MQILALDTVAQPVCSQTEEGEKKEREREDWKRKHATGKTSAATTRVISQTDLSPNQRGPAATTLLPH